MNDLINLLQTLALVLTLLLVILVLVWIVYAFRKFVMLFNHMLEEMEHPRVPVQTNTGATASPTVQETVPPEEPQPLGNRRYTCHRCKAKLPEEPTHSVIKDDISLLVFKCRRCGKETEVDPDKTQPVQPK